MARQIPVVTQYPSPFYGIINGLIQQNQAFCCPVNFIQLNTCNAEEPCLN